MPNWYLYYRLLLALRYGRRWPLESDNTARVELQDVFCDLRSKASNELDWCEQDVQDFFESLVAEHNQFGDKTPFAIAEAQRRIEKENREREAYGG